MPRPVQWLLVAALVVGAFVAGRWSRDVPVLDSMSPGAAGQSESTPGAQPGSPTEAVPNGAVAASSRSNGSPGPAVPVGNAPPNAAPAPLPEVAVSAQAPGPQPLLPGDIAWLDKAQRSMAAEGGTASDLLDLARDEPQDDDARRVEALIAQVIRQKGGRYDQLRLSPPRCSRSVCLMRAVGKGDSLNPRGDWQQLQSVLMNDPAMREVVDDSRTMVTSEGNDTVYISLFIRCAPGTCRFANR